MIMALLVATQQQRPLDCFIRINPDGHIHQAFFNLIQANPEPTSARVHDADFTFAKRRIINQRARPAKDAVQG
jgi:hypothetical protein